MGHLIPQIPQTGDDDTELGLAAIRLANCAAFPMVFKAAIELGVIDTLYVADVTGSGLFLTPSEIASRLPTKPTNPEAPALLDRMLRLLASYSIVKCKVVEGVRVYKPEPICRYFLKDNVNQELGTLASQFIVTLDSVFLDTWAQLKDVVLEGGVAFGRANGGLKLFDYIGKDERLSKLFNRTGFSVGVLKKFLQVYRGFKGVNVLVGVGGGVGDTLGFVTAKYPNIKGINFDLTCALTQAPSYPNVENVAGDMFVDVPRGDAILLKVRLNHKPYSNTLILLSNVFIFIFFTNVFYSVFHDWTDEDCEKILKNYWKALLENGKVIVMEIVTPDEAEIDDVQSNIAFDMDLLMLTQLSGGKERSRAEFEAMATIEFGFFTLQLCMPRISFMGH